MPYSVPPSEPPAIVRPAPIQKSDGSAAWVSKSLILSKIQKSKTQKSPRSDDSVAKPTPPEVLRMPPEDSREQPVLQDAAELMGTGSASVVNFADLTQAQLQAQLSAPSLPQTPRPPAVAPSPSPVQTPQPSAPVNPPTPAPPPNASPPPTPPPSPAPAAPPTPPSNIPTNRLTNQGILELRADNQDYDERRQIFTAQGRVSLRFRGALLTSDRLQVNLTNRLAVAEGNVTLTRGSQVLRGRRFRYNLVQEEGTIEQASGEIFLPAAQTDFNPNLPTDITAGVVPLGASQSAQNVISVGSARITLGSRRNPSGASLVPEPGGQVNRLRFEAAQIAFYPEGWQARNVRITNDPFSPPELELRADRATLTRVSPLRDEVETTRPRLIFDQGFALPLFRRRAVLDRTQRAPALFNLGFDTNDRGGIFVERRIDILPPGPTQFSVTPQFYIQRAFQRPDSLADVFGIRTQASTTLSPRTVIRGEGVLTSLDLGDLENNLRASVRAQQLIGTHTLSLEASYRDRLFNNSLGFQDVQSSLGAVFASPPIQLGKTGINLSYQVGYQFVNAETDRQDLLSPNRSNNRISLGRFQASAAISRGFTLWQGKPLPATQTEGLRYSPTPVVPFLALAVGLTGVGTYYSNGDRQNNLNASVGLVGQLGRSSRDFLDYTRFNLTYSQVFRDGLSPFLFDRVADDRILSAGIIQQIYGPFRIGLQTAYNVQNGREISTDYILEYSRRTYSVALRYNPVLQLGSISLQISDFNWTGGTPEAFDGSGVIPVQGGVRQFP